jgi:GNAT superfamily N-acetyltransferase
MPESTHRSTHVLRVEPLRPSDIRQSSVAHVALLPHGLFPRLGGPFMRRWHQTFVDSDHAQALVVRAEDGSLMGILLGTTDNAAYIADVLARHKWGLGACGAFGLLTRPPLALRFLGSRAGRYRRRLFTARRNPGIDGPRSTPPVAVVHALITLPGHRRKGVASHLLKDYELRVLERGGGLMQLITQAESGPVDFYLRHGWRVTDRRLDKDGQVVVQLDREPGT